MSVGKGNVAITGGAGFIGSHLCDRLIQQGYAVYCIDNLITGSKNNIFHLFNNPQFSFVQWDVINPLPVLPEIKYIFHLASPASVPDYQKYDEETALVNSVGTRNALMFARAYGAKFLYTSTSEVYGSPLEHPQKETYWGNVNPNGVRSCYDESKRFGEMITMIYIRKHKVDGRIVRIFNTYGPNMRKDDGRVISNLINQAIKGDNLTVYGDGSQTRSFCYVSDMVEGLLQAMFSDKATGEVINLGNPDEHSISDIANKIIEMTHSKSTIIYKSLPLDDPLQRKPDISKAKKLLNWSPNVTLDEGFAKTLEYYKGINL